VELGDTEMDEPEPTKVPAQLPLYHFQEAPVPSEPPCFVRVDELPGQIEFGLALAPVGALDWVHRQPPVQLALAKR